MSRESAIETLSYAVRPGVVLHHLGAVSLVLALLSKDGELLILTGRPILEKLDKLLEGLTS